jgi:hypothetical protein
MLSLEILIAKLIFEGADISNEVRGVNQELAIFATREIVHVYFQSNGTEYGIHEFEIQPLLDEFLAFLNCMALAEVPINECTRLPSSTLGIVFERESGRTSEIRPDETNDIWRCVSWRSRRWYVIHLKL